MSQMSTATRVSRVSRLSGIRVRGQPAKVLKPLRRDENRLPIPHVNIIVRDTHASRAGDHYYNTLRDDLMYMTYTHDHRPPRPPRVIRPLYDPEDPYTKHRYNPPAGGPRWMKAAIPPVTVDNVVKLERIQLHTMVKQAIQSKSQLLGAIAAFRAISGDSYRAGGQHTMEGVEIVKGRKSIGGWIRPGVPVGVKVELKGPKMYDFMSILVDFVLPRLKEYDGFVLPMPNANLETPSGASGVHSFGLSPEAMVLFPQIEVNLDAYPRPYGMHIHFITNAHGVGAQTRARKLLSGFQIPFVRP